jgi:predicted O-methyltransferase YrrM
VYHYLPSIHGWCTQEKAEKFIDLMLEIKPDLCVEIGTFGGSSLFPVAATLKYLQHGVIIGIDSWDRFEATKYLDPINHFEHFYFWYSMDFDRMYKSAKNVIRAHDLTDHCRLLKTTSEKAGDGIDQIDFLYIDGNRYESVSLRDVEIYLPKVRSGGYVCINTSDSQLGPAIKALEKKCDHVKDFDANASILLRKR